MKKSIIVLLVAVLAAGFAFAGFSGSASIGYTFAIDSKDNGIVNTQATEYKFEFKLDEAVGGSTGEGNVYAEIAAEAAAGITEEGLDITAEITKANIVAGEFTVNILGPKGAFDYASAYYKNTAAKKPQYNYANAYEIKDHGFVVSYQGYSLSFMYSKGGAAEAVDAEYGWVVDDDNPSIAPVWGITTDAVPAVSSKLELYVGAETKSFELAEGVTAQAAANFHMVEDDKAAGVAAKAAYKNEDAKVSATVAADVEYDNEKVAVDMAATAKYDFVSAKVYFGTSNGFKENTNVLSARVDVAKTIDAVTVSAYAETRDAIKVEHPWILAGAKATYAADQFSVYAGVDASLKYATEYKLTPASWGKTDYAGLGVTAGISSTALINNATVALEWTGSDFSKSGDSVKSLGAITASAKVAF